MRLRDIFPAQKKNNRLLSYDNRMRVCLYIDILLSELLFFFVYVLRGCYCFINLNTKSEHTHMYSVHFVYYLSLTSLVCSEVINQSITHQMDHMSTYTCCGERFSGMIYLLAHLKRHFSEKSTVRYSCTICSAVIRRKADVNDHIYNEHKTLYSYLNPDRVNAAEIQAFGPLLAHNANAPEPMDYLEGPATEPADCGQSPDDGEQCENETIFDCDLDGNVFHTVDSEENLASEQPLHLQTADREIVNFILDLRRQFDVTGSVLNGILQKTANFFKKRIIPSNLPVNLADRFAKLAKSDFLQKQHIDNVSPVTIEKSAIVEGQERVFEIQYFPIMKVLQKVLQLPDVQLLIRTDHEMRLQEQSDEQRQSEERIAAGGPAHLQSAIVKQSAYFEPEEVDSYKLRLIFYTDEFTSLNPLGPSVSETTLLAVYMVVDNLPYYYQSSRKSISTVLLVRKSAIAALGLPAIFERLLEDLKSFRTPIDMGLGKPVAGYAAASTGDNLELNRQQNISRGFGSDNSCTCRFCLLTNVQAAGYFAAPHVPMREDQRSTNGVFTSVQHASLLYGVDPFHDLDEGVCNYFMTAVLKGFYDNQSELDELNEAMQKGNFRNQLVYLKHNRDKIKGTGSQVLEFFIKFVFYDTQISLDSSFWHSYLCLRKINTFAKLENQYYRSMFDHYLKLVKTFTEAFLELGIRMKPKLHNLVHYPLVVEKLCEPYKLAVLRFERKHQPLKKIARNSYNYVHKEKTLANCIFKAGLPKDVRPKFNYKLEKEVCDALIYQEVENRYHPFIEFNENLLILKECTLNGIHFAHSNCYAIKSEKTFRLFVCVFLFKQEDKCKVIGQELKVLDYDLQTDAFHVQKDCILKVIDVNNLYYNHVLYTYQTNVKQSKDHPFHIVNNFHYDCPENHHHSIIRF